MCSGKGGCHVSLGLEVRTGQMGTPPRHGRSRRTPVRGAGALSECAGLGKWMCSIRLLVIFHPLCVFKKQQRQKINVDA